MTQAKLLGNTSVGSSSAPGSRRLKIKVPRFDNSALIQGYSKTLIGRCFNPAVQNVTSLLHMMPRFWKVKERVVGADLGLGKFQIDFDHEEDIVEVLKLEPFHFDGWMVSLVRWKPNLDPNYPSELTFWIKVYGVPLQLWAEETFKSIGDSLGLRHEVDIDNGRVRVTIDGLNPLFFESEMEFADGEEVVVRLKYERLHGVCRCCNSLSHDISVCPHNQGFEMVGDGTNSDERVGQILDENPAGNTLSYKAALVQGQDQNHLGNNEKGYVKNGVAKRALNFEDPGARNQKKQAQFWQQKAKGKQVASRSSKGSNYHVHRNRHQGGIQIGKSDHSREDQAQVKSMEVNSKGATDGSSDGNQQLQLSEFEQRMIMELL